MTKQCLHEVLEQGPRCKLFAVRLPDGTCPASEFLTGLDGHAQAEFKARLGRLTQVGWLRSPELMRRLEVPGTPSVHEVKAHRGRGFRLYLIQHGADWMATHGRPKPSDRRVAAEAERARELVRRYG